MVKTFARIIYSEITPEQFDAVKAYAMENGVPYEYDDGDTSWIMPLNATGAQLVALETSAFGATVTG